MPIVSVLIPYYNDARFLRMVIESVLAQTTPDWQLVLVNHASTDNSREIARSYDDSRIEHIDMPINYGAGCGILMREMFHAAKGKYVKYFCADDVLDERALENSVRYMEENPEIDFAFGNANYIDLKGRSLGRTFFESRKGFSMENVGYRLVYDYMINGNASLPFACHIIRRSALRDEFFDTSCIMQLDCLLWMRLILAGSKIGYFDDIVADYRIHDGQMSSVGQQRTVLTRSHFEVTNYIGELSKSKDVDLIHFCFPDDKYVAQLKEARDIPFVVWRHYLEKLDSELPYYMVHEILSDPRYAESVRVRFGFSIADFRAIYSKKELIPWGLPMRDLLRLVAFRLSPNFFVKGIVRRLFRRQKSM